MPRPRTPLSSYGRITIDAVAYATASDGGRRRLVVLEPPPADPRAHGLWRARTRFRFEDGRLRQVERFGASRAKAEAALKRALADAQLSTGVEVRRETSMRDLSARFLASKADRAPRTIEAYTYSVERVILPRLGDVRIMEATPERLQRFLDAVRLEHGAGAAKTARAVLSGMMGLATRSDAIRQNPVRELALGKAKAKGATAVPLDELPALLVAVRGDERMRELDLVDVVEFVAGTGVRISEALALAWEDVDLGAGVVTIRANVVRATGRGVIRQDHSKTDAGSRRITLPGVLVGVLGDRRVHGGPNPHGLVFPTVLGNLRDPRNTARDWAAARDRLGLAAYTFHSFRKTVATALDQAGLSARDIAEYLGHADPSLTLGVYMSKTVGGSKAASALDAVMGRE
ncbi:tyrosine-type recombinase/integrase [Microbacterium sp.]|uniref:tyrosine-type recombinase/integrase n=1 Tax=Microbacterium sp. TaxID=51671 RepID=UPI0039E2B73A